MPSLGLSVRATPLLGRIVLRRKHLGPPFRNPNATPRTKTRTRTRRRKPGRPRKHDRLGKPREIEVSHLNNTTKLPDTPDTHAIHPPRSRNAPTAHQPKVDNTTRVPRPVGTYRGEDTALTPPNRVSSHEGPEGPSNNDHLLEIAAHPLDYLGDPLNNKEIQPRGKTVAVPSPRRVDIIVRHPNLSIRPDTDPLPTAFQHHKSLRQDTDTTEPLSGHRRPSYSPRLQGLSHEPLKTPTRLLRKLPSRPSDHPANDPLTLTRDATTPCLPTSLCSYLFRRSLLVL